MSTMKFYPVFVDNIAGSVQPQDLRELFSNIGQVIDVVIVADYGFVNMANVTAAGDAIDRLNGAQLHNRLLHVDFSEELKDHFDRHRIPFRATADPGTGLPSRRHPRYPRGAQVESPHHEDAGGEVSHLLHDRHALDERLRRVNAELNALKGEENYSWRDRSRSRSRERYGGGRSPEYRRSRSPAHRYGRERRERRRSDEYHREYEEHHHERGGSGGGNLRIQIGDRHRDREVSYEALAARQEYELFVGGLNNRVEARALASLFRSFGRVLEANCVKNFAFVTLLCEETDAIAAVSQLSGRRELGNKLFVGFKKGTKFEHLNEKVANLGRGAMARDQSDNEAQMQPSWLPQSDFLPGNSSRDLNNPEVPVVNLDGVFNEAKASIPGLPAPVPVAPSPSPSVSSVFSENLIEQFVRSTRQNNDFLADWGQKSASGSVGGGGSAEEGEGGAQDQYFDGYSIAPSSSKPATSAPPEVEEIFPIFSPQKPASSALSPAPVTTTAAGYQTPSSADLKLIMQTIQNTVKAVPATPATNQPSATVTSSDVPSQPAPVNEGPKAQRKIHVSGLNTRVNDFDLKDIFSQYGQINRVDGKLNYAFILMFCSELAVVRCVCELDGRIVKGTKMRVSFMRGSYEDTQEFKEKYAEEIKRFTSPEHKKQLGKLAINPPPKVKLSQIGEGLRNIDMSLSVGPVQSCSSHGQQPPAGAQPYPYPAQPQHPPLPLAAPAQLPAPGLEMNYHYDVAATIHSVQNKVVVLQFSHPATAVTCIAKMIPGQMYINGHTSLGLVIKSNTSHTWPKMVKDFLQIGKKVRMDLKRLSEKEMHEQKDKERTVRWLAPLVWLEGEKPSAEDVTVTRDTLEARLDTGVITRLGPAGGLVSLRDGDTVVFGAENVFWDTDRLKATDSLLTRTDLEVGDVVCVHHEAARDTAGDAAASAGADSGPVTRAALLVWTVAAEVDPWVYRSLQPDTSVRFLATSSTLARQLPGDSEAEHFNVAGRLQQLHLPAGGIVRLTSEAAAQLGLGLTSCEVYFHRSRLHINGTKIQSDQRLDSVLVPGDRVTVDICRNSGDPPFVLSEAGWVALAVRVHTVVRGVALAEDLRQPRAGLEAGCVEARVVHLQPPSEATAPVICGTAVVDSGQFMGQRVEFDRGVCVAWGQSLHRADLGLVLGYGERVVMRLKPYNSYCVDSLWLGCARGHGRDGALDPPQREAALRWLEDRELGWAGWEAVVRGQHQPRRFLPLIGQQLVGRVTSLVETEAGLVTGLRIATECGRSVVADRARLYVYGHWMGRADLAYCMAGGERVSVVLPPRYAGGEGAASLVWVGGAVHAPCYRGAAASVAITETSNTHLKLWLQTKKIDMSIFKALVDGNLPSKNTLAATASSHGLDSETLAEAAVLRELKTKYGSEKIMASLAAMFRSQEAGQAARVPIPGLNRDSSPPPPPGEGPDPPLTSAPAPPLSFPLSSASPLATAGYYSASSVTASYSSAPQLYQQQQQQQPYPPPPPPTTTSQFYHLYDRK